MKKMSLLLAGIMVTAALLGGCGSTKTETKSSTDTEGFNADGAPETTDVTFYGVNDPQISAAQIIADKMGYFDEEGLNVTCQYMLNVPEIAAVMANGEAKIACANNYSTPTWVLNGADIVTIAPTTNMGGTQCLLLRKDLSISSAKDLEGMKMGMVPGSTQYVTFMNMCRDSGVDSTKIESVPLQFADQLSAISKGEIDIMAVPEPWVTKAEEEAGAQLLCSGTKSYIPGAEGDVIWCNMYACIDVQKDWLEENPETVRRILRAMDKATTYINENREEAVAILSESFGMSVENTTKIMEKNIYEFGVDDTYIDTSNALKEFMVEENITPGGQTLDFEVYHDFTLLREAVPDKYTATKEY